LTISTGKTENARARVALPRPNRTFAKELDPNIPVMDDIHLG
jgi:hypothetical protein